MDRSPPATDSSGLSVSALVAHSSHLVNPQAASSHPSFNADEEDAIAGALVPSQRPRRTSGASTVSLGNPFAITRSDCGTEVDSCMQMRNDGPTGPSNNVPLLSTDKGVQQNPDSQKPTTDPALSPQDTSIHNPRRVVRDIERTAHDPFRGEPHQHLPKEIPDVYAQARLLAQAFMNSDIIQNKDIFQDIQSIFAAGLQTLDLDARISSSLTHPIELRLLEIQREEKLESHQCCYCSKVKKTRSELKFVSTPEHLCCYPSLCPHYRYCVSVIHPSILGPIGSPRLTLFYFCPIGKQY